MRISRNDEDITVFIKRFIFIFVFIFCCVFLVNEIFVLARNYCISVGLENRDFLKFTDIPEIIMVANTGSSHGQYGFNYGNDEKFECFNFAMPSQSLSYDERILKQYKEFLESGGVVFIPVSYFSLYSSDETKQEDFESKNERYYYFLRPEYIKEFSLGKYLTIRYFPVLDSDMFDCWWYLRDYLMKKKPEKKCIPEEIKTKEYFDETAQKAFERHNCSDTNGEWKINKQEQDALYGIIKMCRDRGVEPILVTTPFRREYNDRFSKDFYKMFYSDIKNICDDTNSRYLDYSHDENFCDNDVFFGDADHLSEKGSQVFTDDILEKAGFKW